MKQKTLCLCAFITGLFSAEAIAGVASSRAGFDVGMVFPSGFHGTMGGGAALDYGWSLGSAGEIHFHPNVELWFAAGRFYYGPYDYRYGGSDFETSLNFEGRYYFPLPSSTPVKPYVGLGPGIIFSYFHWDPYPYPDNLRPYYYSSGVDVGFNLAGGIDFRLGSRAMAFAELKGKIGGYVDVFKITFGMMFPLGGSY